jgi:uncharacterized protein (TIGR03067 family)
MKKTLFVLALCAMAGTGWGQTTQAKAELPAPAKVPPGPLDGVWLPERCEYQGKDELDAKLKDALRLSIENGEHKLYFLTDPAKMIGQRLSKAELTIDAKKGEFELAMNDGQRKGEKVHGIFEVKDDTLKMCYGPSTEARPTKFEATAEQKGVFNETWKRYKAPQK